MSGITPVVEIIAYSRCWEWRMLARGQPFFAFSQGYVLEDLCEDLLFFSLLMCHIYSVYQYFLFHYHRSPLSCFCRTLKSLYLVHSAQRLLHPFQLFQKTHDALGFCPIFVCISAGLEGEPPLPFGTNKPSSLSHSEVIEYKADASRVCPF